MVLLCRQRRDAAYCNNCHSAPAPRRRGVGNAPPALTRAGVVDARNREEFSGIGALTGLTPKTKHSYRIFTKKSHYKTGLCFYGFARRIRNSKEKNIEFI